MAIEEEDMLVLRSSGSFSATKAFGYFNSKPSAYGVLIENVESKYVKDPFPTAFGEKASVVCISLSRTGNLGSCVCRASKE